MIKKFAISLLLIWTLFLTACPSQSAISRSAKASSQLAGLTLDAVRVTRQAFESNLISLQTKDSIADKLVKLSKGGLAFNTTIKQLQIAYPNGKLPSDKFELLSRLFDTEVIAPFLAVLQDFGLIKNAPQIIAAIEVIRTVVLTIAGVFGKTSMIAKKELNYA
jgi:hypothetical protein